jgi:CPA2 family monovalent cation:H+ antiporter-2
VLVAALARLFGAAPGVALRTGLYLAQAGEFGFVLLTLGADSGLVAPQWMSPVLASMVLSMLATPFIVMYSNRIVMRLSASDWLMQSVQLTTIAKKSINTEARDHLRLRPQRPEPGAHAGRRSIPYMALDLDPDRVRQAAAAGQSVVFGDAARLQSLMAAGLARASAVVVTYLDTPSALKILQLVRACAAGAGDRAHHRRQPTWKACAPPAPPRWCPRRIEGSADAGQPRAGAGGRADARVIRITRDARDARYGLLRGYFHGADDDTVEERHQARLTSVALPAAAPCLGQPLGDLALHAVGVQVVGAARRGRRDRPRQAWC